MGPKPGDEPAPAATLPEAAPIPTPEALRQQEFVPYITVEGTKGGSPIAAAALNAIMYLIDDTRP